MTHITDLFPLENLEEAINERLVQKRRHPTAPLTIYNYTERCQYASKYWNEVTLQCRGLIVDDEGNIVARPFKKFFNYGQNEGPQIGLDDPVFVHDKLDGSLGILYWDGQGGAIASRGAFESEQAIRATKIFREKYAADFRVLGGWTFLFEIIYPENRIVVDYGEMEDLVLLGAVYIRTGEVIGPESVPLWSGPKAETFAYATFADALAAPPRANREGLVVRNKAGVMVKIKQEDYLRLHKIISGLNETAVWEHLSAGKSVDELLDGLPDEFHAWARGIASDLLRGFMELVWAVEGSYEQIIVKYPAGYTRKEFALEASKTAAPSMLFAKLDGKDYIPLIWKALKPVENTGPRTVTSEAAA